MVPLELRTSFDDLVGSKGGGLSTLVRRIEFSTINQSSSVVTIARAADSGGLSISLDELFVHQTRLEFDNAGFRFLLGEESKTFVVCTGSDKGKDQQKD